MSRGNGSVLNGTPNDRGLGDSALNSKFMQSNDRKDFSNERKTVTSPFASNNLNKQKTDGEK